MKMKERDAYRIPVHRELVDVTREVYVAFYQEKRKAKTVKEKDQRNGGRSAQTEGGPCFCDIKAIRE